MKDLQQGHEEERRGPSRKISELDLLPWGGDVYRMQRKSTSWERVARGKAPSLGNRGSLVGGEP